MGAKVVQKKLKKMENQCMESWYVMYYLGKIPNKAYQGFIEKLFTKNATKEEFTRLSTHVTMVFCKFHSKLLNLDPIFGRHVHLSKAYNFCN
jgi:hypothetical protein